jgi:hypothetical protein
MVKKTQAYGIQRPLEDVFPVPIIALRAPTSADMNFDLGQLWVYKTTGAIYGLANVAAGSATWSLLGPGASDVDTLTADSGGAISPVGGNITLAGGTNLTSAGAGSTITLNLDAAITLATSVTSPIYTAAAGLAINAVAGNNITMKMGDAAGVNKVSFVDSASAEVASIDSNGGFTTTGLTFTGLLTALASATIETAGTALNLGSDNSGDAVNLGVGTVARAISVGTSAAAHTVAIGNAAAGAITVDTAAGISLDAATASNFTVTGAGADLTISSVGGSVLVESTEDAALAIRLHANGGVSETIQLHADQGTGVGSVNLLSDVGGLTLRATGLASADAINLEAAAGGIDVDAALQINIASSQNAVDAIRIVASAGGIDIDAVGAATEDINITNTGGSVVVSATEAIADAVTISATAGGIDILAPGAGAGLDIDIINTGGSINLSATEADAAAISLQAASGGLDIDTGLAIIADAAGNVEINSSAGTILIGNDAVSQNISLGTAGARTVTVGSTTTTSALVLQSGTGNITVTGTVNEIDAKFLAATGDDITFQQSPTTCTAANTGGVATGATGDLNLLGIQNGIVMEQFVLGAGQTIIKPVMTSSGLLVSGDLTVSEGFEYNFGAARDNSRHAFTIGTSAAFFFEMQMTVADVSGASPYMIGFRKTEANNATLTAYTDYAMIGLDAIASIGTVCLKTELNGGGTTTTNTTDAWTDGQSHTVRINVSAAGVVTYLIDGIAPTVTAAFTFDNGDVVAPFFRLEHAAVAPGTVNWNTMKIGFQ